MHTEGGAPKEAPGYNSFFASRVGIIILAKIVEIGKYVPPGTYVTLALIKFYRRYLTRHFPDCKQQPTCSTYALRMVRKHGWVHGLEMTLSRMGPCL
jgi:Putative membrane protein insertion efficiency factor